MDFELLEKEAADEAAMGVAKAAAQKASLPPLAPVILVMWCPKQ